MGKTENDIKKDASQKKGKYKELQSYVYKEC